MTKRTESKPKTPRVRKPVGTMTRPHDIPILDPAIEVEQVPDQPFAEGAHDAIDSDLRQRMISESAFRRYVERGYARRIRRRGLAAGRGGGGPPSAQPRLPLRGSGGLRAMPVTRPLTRSG